MCMWCAQQYRSCMLGNLVEYYIPNQPATLKQCHGQYPSQCGTVLSNLVSVYRLKPVSALLKPQVLALLADTWAVSHPWQNRYSALTIPNKGKMAACLWTWPGCAHWSLIGVCNQWVSPSLAVTQFQCRRLVMDNNVSDYSHRTYPSQRGTVQSPLQYLSQQHHLQFHCIIVLYNSTSPKAFASHTAVDRAVMSVQPLEISVSTWEVWMVINIHWNTIYIE